MSTISEIVNDGIIVLKIKIVRGHFAVWSMDVHYVQHERETER